MMEVDKQALRAQNINLSEEELERYTGAFQQIDADGSGEISAKELGEMLGWLGESRSRAQVEEMISRFDEDESGEIGISEFVVLMIKQGFPIGEAELKIIRAPAELRSNMLYLHQAGLHFSEEEVDRIKQVFLLLDTDHSGEMDIDELSLVLRYLGIYQSPEETQRTFDQFDVDGSGTIEFNEFLVLLAKKDVRISTTDIKVIKTMLNLNQ